MRLQRIATVFFRFSPPWLLLTVGSKSGDAGRVRARSEGEVVLYSSLNNEQIVTLVDAFKKKVPGHQTVFLPWDERTGAATRHNRSEGWSVCGRRSHLRRIQYS